MLNPLEIDVRTQVNTNLMNLGWILDSKNPLRNVFLEQPKTDKERKKLKGRKPDYVLYEKGKSTPLIIIETKKRGLNVHNALEQGREYADILNVPIVYATDGVYCKTFHTKREKPLFLNGEELDEFIRELLALRYLETNEINTISEKVIYSRHELIRIFDEANNILRVEGLRAGIERFSEFANILFLKLISENEYIRLEKEEKTNIPREYLWDSFKKKSESELVDFINKLVLPEIANKYVDDNIFSPLQIKNGSVLKQIIDRLDSLTLTDINSDIKGDAFEYFLKESTTHGNDLGEYFTPRHIVKAMVKLANPQLGEKIYDPFCGTGGLLIESFRHIEKNIVPTDRNLEILRKETVYGNEITNTARITKMNMILAGDGHSNIKMINSLANPIDDKYDIVLTNMPYSQKTEYGSLYDLPTTNGDSINVQHCIRAINQASPNGRMAIIVPEGFLFRKDLRKSREYLLKKCYLQTVISLPQGVFLPYTGVKADILFCTKIKKNVNQKQYWFFDIKNEGYTLDNHRRKIEGESDLDIFLANRNLENQTHEETLKINGFNIIEIDEILKNNFILSLNHYKKSSYEVNSKWNIVELKDICEILNGGTPSTEILEYWNGDINWATIEDVKQKYLYETKRKITKQGLENSNAKLLPKNTVIFSSRATIGEVCIAKNETCTNQGFKNFICNEKYIVHEYLYYILKSESLKIASLASGSTFKEVSKERIASYKIPLPSIEKQQEIVDELNNYQKIIDGANLMFEGYKPYFTFNPKWKLVELANIAIFKYGLTAIGLNQGEYRLIRITDITQKHKISDVDCKYVNSQEGIEEYIVKSGDMLIARTGATYGKSVLIETDIKAVFASYLIRINFNETILPKFFWIFSQSNEYWEQANSLVTGTGQPQFNANAIKRLKIPIPSISEQKEIIQKVEHEEQMICVQKKIVTYFKQKIHQRINEIWGIAQEC